MQTRNYDYDKSVCTSEQNPVKSRIKFSVMFSFFIFLSFILSSHVIECSPTKEKLKNIQNRLFRVDRQDSEAYLLQTLKKIRDNELPTFNFTVPKDDPVNACIKMEASFTFFANYTALLPNGTTYINSVSFTLSEADNFTYFGECQPNRNMIEIVFLNEWRLELYFYKTQDTFLFNHVVLYYTLSGPRFPYSIDDGAQSEVYDYVYINSTLSKSYKCLSGITIELGDITILLKNLIIEPFFNKRPNLPFDESNVCPSDSPTPPNQSNEGLLILVILLIIVSIILSCCILFICIRCRKSHRQHHPNQKMNNNNDSYQPIS